VLHERGGGIFADIREAELVSWDRVIPGNIRCSSERAGQMERVREIIDLYDIA